MATKTERILANLPGTFATAPPGIVLETVVDAFGGELLNAENSLAAVMLAHWVDKADQGAELIQDLACIGSLYGLAPRNAIPAYPMAGGGCPPLVSDEDVEEFRARLKRHVRTFLDGTVTVQGILRVAAEALGLDIEDAYADLDAWWTRASETLVTDEPQADEAGALPLPVVTRRRRFVSRAFITDEAAMEILGFLSAQANGQPETRAALEGKVDLDEGVDLSTSHRLLLKIDQGPSVEVNFANLPRPHAALTAEVVEAITRAVPAAHVSAPGGLLQVGSPTMGSSGRVAAEPGAADAFTTLFGETGRVSTGADPQPAVITGTRDLRAPANLGARRVLRLSVDGRRPVDVDVAGEAPDQSSLAEIIDKLNRVWPGLASAAHDPDQDHLRLTSPTHGAASALELLPLRALELIEYPPEPAQKRWTAMPAQLEGVTNDGVVDAELSIGLTARRGTAGATLINLTSRRRIRVRTVVGLGETLTVQRDADRGISAQITEADGGVRTVQGADIMIGPLGAQVHVPFAGQQRLIGGDADGPASLQLNDPEAPNIVVLSARQVGRPEHPIAVEVTRVTGRALPGPALFDLTVRTLAAQPTPPEVYRSVSLGYGLESANDLSRRLLTGPPSALITVSELDKGELLILPRQESHWLYLDCLSARFDFADFDAASFPGRGCSQLGVFDASQFASAPDETRALFGPAPAGSEPAVDVKFDWPSHHAGAFTLNLPADLPASLGGRFDEARFAQAGDQREHYEPVVVGPDSDPESIARVLQRSKLVTASGVGRVPIGWEPHPIPFPPPRQVTLAGGGVAQPARSYLTEPGSGTILELTARHAGVWGNDIVVSIRPAGPARYGLEIWCPGTRFEQARAVVLGPQLQALTSQSLRPQPVGILQAKAAGIEARATRERTFDQSQPAKE